MKLQQTNDARLVLIDGFQWLKAGVLLILVLLCLVGAVQLVLSVSGLTAFLALLFAIGFSLLLWNTMLSATAVFDRQTGQLTVDVKRAWRKIVREQVRLDQIERIIVLGDSDKNDLTASSGVRPAIVADGRVVPLTTARFGNAALVLGFVASIREFLRHPAGDIIEDSLESLTQQIAKPTAGKHLSEAEMKERMGYLAAARNLVRVQKRLAKKGAQPNPQMQPQTT